MLLHQSPTLVQIIRRGLLLIALLLVVGQLAAIISVNRLTRQSGQSVYDAAEALYNSQLLATEIALMERSAQQYRVVGDRKLYDTYLDQRRQFLHYAGALAEKPVGEVQRGQLASLIAQEDGLFRVLSNAAPDSAEARDALDGFWILNNTGRSILAESQGFIRDEVIRIQEAADGTKRQLIVQAVVFIAAAFVLAVWYNHLINRPIGALEHAISKLGKGDRTERIRVTGPRDLHELGMELDGLRQRLLALEQQKELLLRNVSHELKTPLATIREGIELLNDRVPGALTAEQSEIVEIVRADSLKLQRLIEDLVRLNAAQGEATSMTWQPVELRELLDEVLDEHRLLMAGRGLSIRPLIEAVTVPGDRGKLKAVFENVVSNAVKYSPDGGEIVIALRRDARHVIVDVADEGPGVARAERQKIFDVFYRAGARSAGPVKGSGVGLAIAQAYVHLHKGTIEVVDAPKGATLRVALPRVAE